MKSYVEIELRLKELFPDATHPPYPADSTYEPADEKWISKHLNGFVWKTLAYFKLLRWRKTHDCDNKSRIYMVCAQAAWGHHANEEKDAQAYAVGRMSYYTGRASHSINFALVGEDLKLRPIEPQTQRFVYLTPEAIRSCRFWEI